MATTEGRHALAIGKLTDAGPRPTNQDCVGVFAPSTVEETEGRGHLVVVADGMGGHEGGSLASQIAVDSLAKAYKAREPYDPAAILHDGFVASNQAVLRAAETEGHHGMGTTLTALAIVGHRAYIAHAGDSRVYRIRKGAILMLTEDHSFVNRLLKDGLINDEEARAHSHRNVITNAVGMREMRVQLVDDVIERGDVFLLCTDGIHKILDEPALLALVDQGGSPQAVCERIMEAARPTADDNMSVIVVRIESLPEVRGESTTRSNVQSREPTTVRSSRPLPPTERSPLGGPS